MGILALVLNRPVSPPPEKPVQESRTPNFKDGFFTILVQECSDIYQKNWPVRRGQPYASLYGASERVIADFSTNPLYFLKSVRPGNSSQSDFGSSDLWTIWIFASKQLAQSAYDAKIDYPGDDTSFPRFTRLQTVKRQDYEASPTVAYGSNLTALLSVAITAPGTGYTQATGTVGNAAAQAVCYNGAIIDWIVTVEGSGITNGAALTITGDGTGATATARVQPTAKLSSQEKQEFPQDSPWNLDWIQVARVYETLPGPYLPFRRYDDHLGKIMGTRRAVVNTGQQPSLSANQRVSYESRDGSSYVIWEIVEEFGSAIADNSFPNLYGAMVSGEFNGEVVDTAEQVVTSGTAPDDGLLVLQSVVTPRDPFLSDKKTTALHALPDDLIIYSWDVVALPTLLFDIVNTVYCNESPQATVVTNPVTSLGCAALCLHRLTRSWSDTQPTFDPEDMVPADIQFKGKLIAFSYQNVLNDGISEDATFYWGDGMTTCGWTEEYDFAASTPSATAFAAGLWITKGTAVKQIGPQLWQMDVLEYYSIPCVDPT